MFYCFDLINTHNHSPEKFNLNSSESRSIFSFIFVVVIINDGVQSFKIVFNLVIERFNLGGYAGTAILFEYKQPKNDVMKSRLCGINNNIRLFFV